MKNNFWRHSTDKQQKCWQLFLMRREWVSSLKYYFITNKTKPVLSKAHSNFRVAAVMKSQTGCQKVNVPSGCEDCWSLRKSCSQNYLNLRKKCLFFPLSLKQQSLGKSLAVITHTTESQKQKPSDIRTSFIGWISQKLSSMVW